MVFEMKQDRKEMFTADFTVWDWLGRAAGAFHLEGSMTEQWVTIRGEFLNRSLEMRKYSGGFRGLVGMDRVEKDRAIWPYTLFCDGREEGVLYQMEEKTGFLQTRPFTRIRRVDVCCESYSVALGREGFRDCIYRGEEQIALIETEAVIHDALHPCRITAVDDWAAETAAVLYVYEYGTGAFRPGMKVTRSEERYFGKTRDKFLLSRYDETFRDRFGGA